MNSIVHTENVATQNLSHGMACEEHITQVGVS